MVIGEWWMRRATIHDSPVTIHKSPMHPDNLALYNYLFAAFAFLLGACVGSFLNVCIYRMPLGLSVNKPKRSFCPMCPKDNNQIAWQHNLPLVAWLALRGRCAKCGCRIPFRYFGVELLTAALFLAIWLQCGHAHEWLLAAPYFILASLLVTATFIDFEHFIIPDEITIGGTVAGVLFSLAIPSMMRVESHLVSAAWSLAGAAIGFAVLWGVVEAGKLAFGKKRVTLDGVQPFAWTRKGDDAELKVGDDTMQWADIFSRESDQLLVKCSEAEVAGKRYTDTPLRFFFNRLVVGGDEYELIKLDTIVARVSELTIPREAMGFGDVKFIAAIGAFLGWKAVLFTIMSASMTGALFGVVTILLRRREWSAKIPFGPYLALGAMLWMFAGPKLVGWYLSLMSPAAPM